MIVCARNDFITTLGMCHQAQLIAHRTTGDEKSCFFTYELSRIGFQFNHCGVILRDIIADRRRCIVRVTKNLHVASRGLDYLGQSRVRLSGGCGFQVTRKQKGERRDSFQVT